MDLDDSERNILFVGNKNNTEGIIKSLSNSENLEYSLNILTANSITELFSILLNENKINYISMIDNLDDISQEEVLLNFYRNNSIMKNNIIFHNSIDNFKKLSQLLISDDSISTDKNIDNFINERFKFYDNMNNQFSQDYFTGNTKDYNLIGIFQLIEDFRKTGVLNIKSSNTNVYFEFYFKEGNLISAHGNNGFFPISKLDALKEFLKENNFKSTHFEFLSDISTPDIHFNQTTSEIISEIYKSIKIELSNTNNSSLVKYEDIRKTILVNTKSGKNERKTILINKKNKRNILEKKGEEIMIGSVDLEKAVEIAEDVYWVAVRDPKTLLQVNTYLRVFRKDSKMVSLLIDPGPIEYFPGISKKVSSVIKDISRVNMYYLNHQDADVSMNSTFLARMNPKAICLCSEDTWRLVRFYEIPYSNFKDIYSFENHSVTISTDPSHVIQFVPTRYCHFVGAAGVYDKKTRVLFSGDLFGSLSPANNLELFATEEHWEGMKTFHQIYMPSSKIVRRAIDNIRALEEPPLMIAPHHGAILTGEVMELFMNRLYHLDIGDDLFDKPQETSTATYLDLMNRIFVKFSESVGIEALNNIFNFSNKNQELSYLIDIDENGIKNIFSSPQEALTRFIRTIEKYHDYSVVSEIKSLLIKEALVMRVNIPQDLYLSSGIDDTNESAKTPSLDVFQSDNSFKEEDIFA